MNRLGDFLRSRRARVSPAQAELPLTTGRRRTPGLRREEVAMLAGISIEYYSRLEQGRQHRPSQAVLDAIAAVLRLDEDEAAHLTQDPSGRAPVNHPGSPSVRPEVRYLLQIVHPYPAHLLSRSNDLLAANEPGLRLLPGLDEWEPTRRDLARYTFLHPAARELYRNWEDIAATTVAHLRSVSAAADATVHAIVAELLAGSPEFARLWDRYDVRARTNGVKAFDHPEVGRMTLGYEALGVARTDGQRLVVYQAPPGSPAHDALLLLEHLSVSTSS